MTCTQCKIICIQDLHANLQGYLLMLVLGSPQ